MNGFFLGLWTVFVAELGDKTQLVALCLASRFRARVVLAGIFAATLVVHIISVLLGGGVGKIVPQQWIGLVAGLAFVGFGLWTLRGDSLSDEECSNIKGRSPFWLVFTTFFLAELGDKTMIATVTLAMDNPLLPVWLGSSLGMVFSDALAIGVGALLGRKLPERPVRVVASTIFFVFGAYSIFSAKDALPAYAWPIAAAIIGAMVILFARSGRQKSGPVPEPSLALDDEPGREEVGARR